MNLYQKFKEQEILNLIPKGTVVVAVSGGADSVALLHLVFRCSKERGWKLVVAHIQHGLRGKESLRDEKFVENLSKKLNLPFETDSIPVKEYSLKNKIGIEESARILRYDALAKIALKVSAKTLLVAHNANDQVETFFLNLIRGSGMDGLSAIFPLRTLDQITNHKEHSKIQIVRPLLSFDRGDILHYLKSQNLSYCKDKTNQLQKYRRNWVRQKLVPLLKKVQPEISERISNLTELFRMERELKMKMLKKMEKKVIHSSSCHFDESLRRRGEIFKARFLANARNDKREANCSKIGSWKIDLPAFFRYDLKLRYDFLHYLFPEYSFEKIKEIEKFLLKEKNKNKKVVSFEAIAKPLIGHSGDHRETRICNIMQKNRFWTSQNNGTVSLNDFHLKVPGITKSTPWNLKVKIQFLKNKFQKFNFKSGHQSVAYFNADGLNGTRELKIRSWKKGDKFQPFGMNGTKKIQDFFTDQKILKEKRTSIPILEINGQVGWIVGYRTDERLKINPITKKIMKVEVQSLA